MRHLQASLDTIFRPSPCNFSELPPLPSGPAYHSRISAPAIATHFTLYQVSLDLVFPGITSTLYPLYSNELPPTPATIRKVPARTYDVWYSLYTSVPYSFYSFKEALAFLYLNHPKQVTRTYPKELAALQIDHPEYFI